MCPVPSLHRTRPAAVACCENVSTHAHAFLFHVLVVLVENLDRQQHTHTHAVGLINIILCVFSLSMDKGTGSFAQCCSRLFMFFFERAKIFLKTMTQFR